MTEPSTACRIMIPGSAALIESHVTRRASLPSIMPTHGAGTSLVPRAQEMLMTMFRSTVKVVTSREAEVTRFIASSTSRASSLAVDFERSSLAGLPRLVAWSSCGEPERAPTAGAHHSA
jgi:hypothetical protein